MPLKTITKFTSVVILAILTTAGLSSCAWISFGGHGLNDPEAEGSSFGPPEVLARIASPKITESSGLAVSKCQENVFWTHNDSGDGPFIYAFNSKGETLGTWRVAGATSTDWEDIATTRSIDGKCYLFIGEIGDNEGKRDTRVIYRVAEPGILSEVSAELGATVMITAPSTSLKFEYPNGRHNAEALLVNPVTNAIYIITKRRSGPAEVFRLSPDFDRGEAQIAKKVADISLPSEPEGSVTGGDISPDGVSVVVCDYHNGYELSMKGTGGEFDNIWLSRPVKFDLGPRVIGESIAFGNDANNVFATTERANPPLIRVIRK